MSSIGIKSALSGLARKLVADGILKADVAERAAADSARKKVPFVTYLVENNLANSTVVANAASHEFGIPLFDLNAMEIDSSHQQDGGREADPHPQRSAPVQTW